MLGETNTGNKPIEVNHGDRIEVKAHGIIVKGIVARAEYHDSEGWYIEIVDANVPGKHAVWKQWEDKGYIHSLNGKVVPGSLVSHVPVAYHVRRGSSSPDALASLVYLYGEGMFFEKGRAYVMAGVDREDPKKYTVNATPVVTKTAYGEPR